MMHEKHHASGLTIFLVFEFDTFIVAASLLQLEPSLEIAPTELSDSKPIIVGCDFDMVKCGISSSNRSGNKTRRK